MSVDPRPHPHGRGDRVLRAVDLGLPDPVDPDPVRALTRTPPARPDVAATGEDGGMSNVLERFGPATQDWFRGAFAEPTPRAARRVGCHLARQARARGRPDRLGQDALGVPLGDRPGLPREGCRSPPGGDATRRTRERLTAGIPHPHPLHLAAQGARRRRRAQPPLAARRHRPVRAPARDRGARGDGRRALRRHHLERPAQARHGAARHPHHDARVALPDAHEPGRARRSRTCTP